jgi:hypothetical protein
MAEERLSYSPLLMQGAAMIELLSLLPRPRAHVAANFGNFRW